MLHVKTFWPVFPIYWELMTSLRLFTLTFPAQFSVKIQPMLMLMKLLNAKVKFKYSEKAIKFCKISTLDLSCVVRVKSRVKILQNFVAFSEYMNFKYRKFRLSALSI